MTATKDKHAHIKGWGVDLDRSNRPAVPMERTPPRLEGVHWDEPEQQPQRIEVLHSLEKPGITPVFGTSMPPSGISGRMRRKAFERTENDIRHWLMLMAADRVDVMEGRLDDLRRMPATRQVATAALLGGVTALALWMHRRRDSHGYDGTPELTTGMQSDSVA
ncbi:MAG: hypothetical protein M3Q40_03465 [Pseudomonadota bacterium]|nr:hypothetical protein [Pseudomonadota bacterium]